MVETQASVTAWADETFGTVNCYTRAIDRVEDEMMEFVDIPYDADPEKFMGEAADVVITLYRLASVLGRDLHAEIDRKMHINRHERRWKPDGTGHGQHIKD